jgi:hypothetical protein
MEMMPRREITSLSETHGVLHGEKVDTSELPSLTELVSVVATWTPSGPRPTEHKTFEIAQDSPLYLISKIFLNIMLIYYI